MKKNGITLKEVINEEQGKVFPIKCGCGNKDFEGGGIGSGLSVNMFWECKKCGATVETNSWYNRKLEISVEE